jgi:hypothetical protein
MKFIVQCGEDYGTSGFVNQHHVDRIPDLLLLSLHLLVARKFGCLTPVNVQFSTARTRKHQDEDMRTATVSSEVLK